MRKLITVTVSVTVFTAIATFTGVAQQNQMSFFVTSAGPGNGANLGGLAGADKQCQTLAAAAGRRQPHLARLSQRRRRPTGSPRSTPRTESARVPGTTRRA